MRALPGKYLLSLIDHKSEVVLSGVIIHMRKDMENNFRERNPQLGKVEAICEADNPLQLKVGDIVAVNHRTFYKANVASQRGYEFQDHVEYNGVKYFRPLLEFIYFKYNNKTPELLPGIIICTNVKEQDILGFDSNSGDFLHKKEFEQKATILVGNDIYPKGSEVLVLKNALYLITLDRVDYFKVRESEIVAINGKPAPGYFAVEYLEKPKEHFLDLSYVKQQGCLNAKSDNGETLYIWRNQGVELMGKRIISEDNVIWHYETA